MELFKVAESEACFLKMGFYGSNGSGKTYTASLVAIGLHKLIKSKKPIFFLDSETGSDYVLPLFQKEKIELRVAKSKAFSDLLLAVDTAEKDGSILIADSVSHHWDELIESYKRKKNLKRLFMHHWGDIKPTWREFSGKYVTSKLHIIICGRSGDVWQDIDDGDGVKELKKVGTRMRVERELGYEPSLLVEMEKVIKSSGWTHRALIEKDRFDVMNFKHFDDPKFEDFLPHIQKLNLGGKHRALDVTRDSQEMFDSENDGNSKFRKMKILTEKVQNAVYRAYPGQAKEDKIGRLDLLKKAFDTDSWTAISSMRSEDLDVGLKIIESEITKEAKHESTSI